MITVVDVSCFAKRVCMRVLGVVCVSSLLLLLLMLLMNDDDDDDGDTNK